MSSTTKAYATGMFLGFVMGVSVYLPTSIYIIVGICTVVIGALVMAEIRGEE